MGIDGVIGMDGIIGVTGVSGHPGPTGMNKIEYRKLLRTRKIKN